MNPKDDDQDEENQLRLNRGARRRGCRTSPSKMKKKSAGKNYAFLLLEQCSGEKEENLFVCLFVQTRNLEKNVDLFPSTPEHVLSFSPCFKTKISPLNEIGRVSKVYHKNRTT
jgi:hypothetical protein